MMPAPDEDIIIRTHDGDAWTVHPGILLADLLAIVADAGGTIEIRFPPKGET